MLRELVKMTGSIALGCFVFVTQAATIPIDTLSTNQALQTACIPETKSNTSTGSGIWGGTRILQLTLENQTGSPEDCTRSNIYGSNWSLSNDAMASGSGRLIWSGSNAPSSFVNPPLNLDDLVYFNFDYVYSDLPTKLYIELWSSPDECSFSLITNLPGGASIENIKIAKANFSKCASTSTEVDFSKVGRIEVYMSPYMNMESVFRGFQAVVGDPPAITCMDTAINGSKNYVVADSGCHDVNVSYVVRNDGGVPSYVTIFDQLAAGMTVTSNPICDQGLNFGDQILPSATWTSTDKLPAKQQSTCMFEAKVCGVNPGTYVTNIIKASPTGEEAVGSCAATIANNSAPPRPLKPPKPIPSLSEWAELLMMMVMVAIVGWLGLRKKASV